MCGHGNERDDRSGSVSIAARSDHQAPIQVQSAPACLNLHNGGADLGHPESVPDTGRNLRDRRRRAQFRAACDLAFSVKPQEVSAALQQNQHFSLLGIAMRLDVGARLRYDDQPLNLVAATAMQHQMNLLCSLQAAPFRPGLSDR